MCYTCMYTVFSGKLYSKCFVQCHHVINYPIKFPTFIASPYHMTLAKLDIATHLKKAVAECHMSQDKGRRQ